MEVKNVKYDDVFDSSFNSIEFEGFLSKMEVKCSDYKNLNKKKLIENSKSSPINEKCGRKNSHNNKDQYYNLPLSLDDLSEDLEDFIQSDKKIVTKNLCHNSVKNNEIRLMESSPKICLSPINGKFFSSGLNHSFSSTPIKKDDQSNLLKDTAKGASLSNNIDDVKDEKTVFTKADYEYFDADLFEDWDKDDFCLDVPPENKSSITLSQALKLIEESEARNSEEPKKDDLNDSIDLLTGEIIQSKVKDNKELFEDSFNLSKLESAEKKIKNSLLVGKVETKNYEVITINDSMESREKKVNNKSSAAQKLNFGTSHNLLNCKEITNDKENLFFDIDDSFDMFSKIINEKKSFGARAKECLKADSDFQASVKNFLTSKEPNTEELSDDSVIVVKRKGKLFRVSESDSGEDSSDCVPLKQKKFKPKKWKKGSEDTTGRQFIDSEAEVSKSDNESSDESESEDDKFEESFLDEFSYFTQNISCDMTAKYLESVKVLNNRPGTFKIPEAKPYDPDVVFSQYQPDTNTDYEIDSFCVSEIPEEEEEENSELHVLEIAEKVLEMDRKKRKKKGKLRSRKTKRI